MHTTCDAATDFGPRSADDVQEFQSWMNRATREQKESAIYWVLRSRCGQPFTQEFGVDDPECFVYACVIPPEQLRKYRLLEGPGRELGVDWAGISHGPRPTRASEELQDWLARATPKKIEGAIDLLLRDRLGHRFTVEYGVHDPDGNLFAVVISLGQRAAYRFLEDPGLEERLLQAAKEPGIPVRQIWQELGIDMTEFE